MEFKETRVLVTGGTRGIGRGIVEAFAAQGARVAFTYRSSEAVAEELKEATGGLAFQCDAADFDGAEQVVTEMVTAWGGVDVLVNNAGITRDNLLMRMSESDWDVVINANLKSIFNYSKAVYRVMMRQRYGRIVNISSIVGLTGNPGQANYAASKAGIIGISKSLAKELGARGVTVNVVAPGYVETDMTEGISEKMKENMIRSIPVRRTAVPEEIAAPVLFLASREAAYITGQVLTVDGGLAM
ncbi:MAG: 3-oxoacyl-[acyl-carrier-protein] reductase [Rhodothermaceae bacterium]|nr:3-oxoacyl-[acyl-carrier-protein] reductase [Rhodothermaceae bacterium]MXX59087.1 3-oxoacyl-[acyl-carrier-protein] reductase [Rhodothermaceae bacterium]MYD18425.1 3-oxoacyl-[acyl-carrier-protein] reductase [Rhodothermaceae bacterium]MYD55755.1 3-oxoacyl-[acyl-carrier-protein] reductase [Rhodothermaceae bacterium]MYI44432.1 3-oxoacyl-[acyl-carrier-protein] reductase [Rhodothermaceae bacterium]